MRDHSKHITLTREDAVSALLERITFNPETETLPVNEAFGRVLAQDVFSRIQAPGTLTCRMDSVALHFDDFAGLAEGTIPDTSCWKQGIEWEFANTGVAMPPGFDTALRVEDVDIALQEDGTYRLSLKRVPGMRGEGTKPAGSDHKIGDILAQRGSVLTPLLLSNIASGAHTEVSVIKKPIVAFIPTGNELVELSTNPAADKNLETNSILIRGKIEAWGGQALVWPPVKDEQELVKKAILDAVEQADIVVINGGSSKGSEDWTMEVLETIGEVLCHETNHGPGRHTSMSVVAGKPIIGISGPPLGASFTTDFYLLPVMQRYFGHTEEIPKVKATLTKPFAAGGPGGPGGGHGRPGGPGGLGGSAGGPGKQGGPAGPGGGGPGPNFFAVQQLCLKRDPDSGALLATPVDMSEGAIELDKANAYYRLRPALGKPNPGDLIEVELRWPYVI